MVVSKLTSKRAILGRVPACGLAALTTWALLSGCNLERTAKPSGGLGLGTKDAGSHSASKTEQLEPQADAAAQSPKQDAGALPDSNVQHADAGESAGDAASAVVEMDAESTKTDNQAQHSTSCIDGVSIVLSDYVSTQIALSDLKGMTLAEHFVSTASATTDGLAFALSGDVTVPSSAPASGRVVLLDRFGTNVISWFDPATAENIAQLPVGTGFESNPQDYVEVGDIAFVSRWGQNELPGAEDFDDGGDVLVIDISGDKPSIIDSIVMPTAGDLPARPGGMTLHGNELIVSLERVASDFSTTGEAMWVGIDVTTQEVSWKQTFDGLKLCGRPVLSPDGSSFATACTGQIDFDGVVEDLDQSVVLLLDANTSPPQEIARYKAKDLAGEPLQDDVVFADQNLILFKTQTAWGGDTNNRWLALDLKNEKVTKLLEASPDADGLGQGIVYTGMVCAPGCSDYCLLADSEQSVIQRVKITDGKPKLVEPVVVEDSVGLPPVGLGPR